jgi:hypothetical protein
MLILRRFDGRGLKTEWGRREKRIGCWRESHRGKDHLEEQDIGGCVMLRWILERWDGIVLTGLVWLRIGTSGGELLWMCL